MSEVRALGHVVFVLQQQLSDGRRIHVERAVPWAEMWTGDIPRVFTEMRAQMAQEIYLRTRKDDAS